MFVRIRTANGFGLVWDVGGCGSFVRTKRNEINVWSKHTFCRRRRLLIPVPIFARLGVARGDSTDCVCVERMCVWPEQWHTSTGHTHWAVCIVPSLLGHINGPRILWMPLYTPLVWICCVCVHMRQVAVALPQWLGNTHVCLKYLYGSNHKVTSLNRRFRRRIKKCHVSHTKTITFSTFHRHTYTHGHRQTLDPWGLTHYYRRNRSHKDCEIISTRIGGSLAVGCSIRLLCANTLEIIAVLVVSSNKTKFAQRMSRLVGGVFICSSL